MDDDDGDDAFEDVDNSDEDDVGGAASSVSFAPLIGRKASSNRVKRKRSINLHGSADQRRLHQGGESDWSDWDSDQINTSQPEHKVQTPGPAPVADPDTTVETLHAELLDILECQLCYNLLYEPLTTPCGHTFCKSCFSRSLDHGDKCPLCRSAMPSFAFFQEHPCNFAITRLLTTDVPFTESVSEADAKAQIAKPGPVSAIDLEKTFTFRHLYDARRISLEEEQQDAKLSTPVFVCTLAFPGMPTVLHIFEPRYRLMIRRCLESGNPR